MNKRRMTLVGAALVTAGALAASVFFLPRGGAFTTGAQTARSGAGDPRAGGRSASRAQPPVVSINGVPSPPPTTDDQRQAAQVQRMYRARLVQRGLDGLKASSATTGVDLAPEAVDKAVHELQARLDDLEAAQQ